MPKKGCHHCAFYGRRDVWHVTVITHLQPMQLLLLSFKTIHPSYLSINNFLIICEVLNNNRNNNNKRVLLSFPLCRDESGHSSFCSTVTFIISFHCSLSLAYFLNLSSSSASFLDLSSTSLFLSPRAIR